MAAIMEDTAEVAVAVPQVYKDYLAPRHLGGDLKLLGFHLITLAILFIFWKWLNHNQAALTHLTMYAAVTALYILLTLITWRRQAAQPWQYVINEKRFLLIQWQFRIRFWDWHSLIWDREVICGIEEDEWRGLPALRIKTAGMRPEERRIYTMVYSHEDRERVMSEIIPLVQRFRHDFWCEIYSGQAI